MRWYLVGLACTAMGVACTIMGDRSVKREITDSKWDTAIVEELKPDGASTIRE